MQFSLFFFFKLLSITAPPPPENVRDTRHCPVVNPRGRRIKSKRFQNLNASYFFFFFCVPVSFPGQQTGAVAVSDPSTANVFAASGFPYFDQLIGDRQTPFDPYFRKVDSSSANKSSQESVLTIIGKFGPNEITSSSAKPEATAGATTGAILPAVSPASKKVNTVKVIPDVSYDPFNGQLPLL